MLPNEVNIERWSPCGRNRYQLAVAEAAAVVVLEAIVPVST
jgi:hypothetical protein